MKKFIAPLLIGAALSSSAFAADDSLKQEVEALKVQMAELKNAQSKINVDALKAQVSEIKAHDAGDNIKWDVDFRTAYDYVDYKVNSGMIPAGDTKNGIWTNKLILGMSAQPADNLVFKGSLAAYKMFGNNGATGYNPFQNMDWYSSESPDDSTIRLREAYFLYMGDMGDVPYTVSFGRRPSVDGFITNLRADNEHAASPIGHNINMEFDGASFKFDLDKVTGISGMYFKICLGRGNSDADSKYGTFDNYMGSITGTQLYTTALPYAKSSLNSPNMDLAGAILQIYDNGQYKVMANYFKGWNMMGANVSWTGVGVDGNPGTMDDTYHIGLSDVGDLTGGALSLQVNGIGDGISDFLDDSIFFLSYAFSQTDPKGAHGVMTPFGIMQMAEMLGSQDKETGSSIYTGVQVPGIMKNQRLGLEYNHGSKYWRSFTYGEDTLVGSKLATRGDAYEIYYILPVVGKNLTAQVTYTYIDYKYSGSNMFFDGNTGTPMTESEAAAAGMGFVKSASDIRLALRYRY